MNVGLGDEVVLGAYGGCEVWLYIYLGLAAPSCYLPSLFFTITSRSFSANDTCLLEDTNKVKTCKTLSSSPRQDNAVDESSVLLLGAILISKFSVLSRARDLSISRILQIRSSEDHRYLIRNNWLVHIENDY